MTIPGDPQGIDIVPGSMKPCACGNLVGDLKIKAPEGEGATLQGTHDAVFICKCGNEIPCKVKIDLQRHKSN